MPYITQDARKQIRSGRAPVTAGELNFCITKLCYNYIRDKGHLAYASLNDVLGALEGAKLELYRRTVGPYEDTRIALNGDVGADVE